MNERIIELAEQAGVTSVSNLLCAFHYAGPIRAEFLEKFAELIVKECAKIAHECGPTVVNGSERQFDPVTYTAIQILEHFGVEE
jgi:hypothetical protein